MDFMKLFRIFLAILFSCLCASNLNAGKIYIWEDKDGVVHFTQQSPPKNTKDVETIKYDVETIKYKDITKQVLLYLNTATGKELRSIKGIGLLLAERIIHGRPYRTLDDLLKVEGIGPQKLQNIYTYFAVGKK